MKKMPRTVKSVMLLLLVLVLAFIPITITGCSDDGATTIEMQTPYAESDITGKAAKKFKELVEKYTDGEVEVTLFFNGSLYSHAEQFEALKTGALDAAVQNVGYCRPFDPNFDFSGMLQGLIVTKDHATAVNSDPMIRQFVSDLFEDYNIHFTDYLESYLISATYLTNFEIDSLWDLDGQKLYTGRPGDEEPFEALVGAERVYVDMTELSGAVNDGQIDVFPPPALIAWANSFYTLFDDALFRPFYNTNLILFNLDVWDGLPDDVQDIITNQVMPEVMAYTSDIAVEDHKVAVKGLVDNLDTTHVVWPAEEDEIWEQLKVYPAFVEKAASMNQDILNRIIELRPATAELDEDMIEILEYAGFTIPEQYLPTS